MSSCCYVARPCALLGFVAWLLLIHLCRGEVQVVVNRNQEDASAAFRFREVPPPSRNDAATAAKFTVLDGRPDQNGGEPVALQDGVLPTDQDEPAQNFFFAAGTSGGRLLVDLKQLTEIKAINTYSWHPAFRGPQVYRLFAADGTAAGFDAQPLSTVKTEQEGWMKVAEVDTRGDGGGQFGVSISASQGALGKFRYLLFEIQPAETNDAFGNTFYSEIDVVEVNAPAEPAVTSAPPLEVATADGYCRITIDTARAPELADWAKEKLSPVMIEWYPKIAALLASDGFTAPKRVTLRIAPGNGVAATSGTRINANSKWVKGALRDEAVGAIVHELVHVVQQYNWRGRGGARPPGWLTEGIPDYVRFFIYEPESHGADLVYFRGRRNTEFNHDGLYRVSANFLDYVIRHYDSERRLLATVNAACRNGEYDDEIWEQFTGRKLSALNEQWRAAMQQELGARPAPASSSTEQNRAAKSEVTAGNPIFQGWYADPEGTVFGDRYWVYPTYSAPYEEQVFFDAFSSPDLVSWTKHSRILDTNRVTWARRAMWAPSVIEKGGRYYFFFGANDIQNDQQPGGIGVAVSDNPGGPFEDYLGRPLIDRFHNGAQPIDQFAFRDKDGQHYLIYGGWRHCNIARLRNDFRGFEPFADGTTFKEITPRNYVEGPFMFIRNGKYYFMWSEGGWTGPDYSVAYAIADTPQGPFSRIGKILQQDPKVATGAGHHSVIQVPGKDEYYIVYHRRPLGETDGNHRVTCVDRMEFDDQGFIKPVKITFEGVASRPLK